MSAGAWGSGLKKGFLTQKEPAKVAASSSSTVKAEMQKNVGQPERQGATAKKKSGKKKQDPKPEAGSGGYKFFADVDHLGTKQRDDESPGIVRFDEDVDVFIRDGQIFTRPSVRKA